MRLRTFLLPVLVLIPVAALPATRLTLRDAVESALARNHALAAARLEMERAEARVNEAWGYALPNIDLGARYSRALKKPVFFLPDFENLGSGKVMPIEIGSDHAYDVNLTASQVLFNSTVFIGVGSAHIYSRAAQETYRARRAETVASARKAFYRVLVARSYADLMREILQNAEENLRNARVLAAQGLLSDYDQLRAEVAAANVRPEVLTAENGARLALNALKEAIGLPTDEEIVVEDSLVYVPVPDSIVARALDSVMAANPSLHALRLQTEVNDAFVSVERSNYLPSLAAFGTYQLQAQKNRWGISTADFIGSAQVGVSLSMNLFAGLRTNARVEQAELELEKSRRQLAGFELTLRTAVDDVTLRLRTAGERLAAQERTVEQARRGYRIATARFASGSGTQLELNDAQLALTRAALNRIQALYDYLEASADLDQLLGRMPDFVREEENP